MKPLQVLGLMSGTSLDGVDGALCECRPERVRLCAQWSTRFPSSLKRRLLAAAGGFGTGWGTAQLHHDLGRFYASTVRNWRIVPGIDAVGLHGQTIFHRPHPTRPATLQIGEPAYLAEALRVPVVADFRVADLAAGGQGAPLATRLHQVAFARPGRCIAVNNLGGISNVTLLDWSRGGEAPHVLAFDTGPANLLLDSAVQKLTAGRRNYDRAGAWARRGAIDEARLRRWLRHPYIRRRPPKSTGRELFGEEFLARVRAERPTLSPANLLATLTEFTAASIALNYRWHLPCPPETVILCGGGASNDFLRERIAHHFSGVATVETSQDHGWPVSAVEPAAFALLAAERLWRRPGNVPSATGAIRAVLLGKLVEAGG